MPWRLAPAKINLTLEVLARRDDGYHEVRSVMQALDLADTLYFNQADATRIEADIPGWEADKSLMTRAVASLQQATGCQRGVEITVEKRVPLTSGLGGDSSDAAAALLGLNDLWRTGLTTGRLHELAAELGSDVPFFLAGGTQLARGRGQELAPLAPLAAMPVVLLSPDIAMPENKTARVFAALKSRHFTAGDYTDRVVTARGAGPCYSPEHGFNAFDEVAARVFPKISRYVSDFVAAGAGRIQLAGAGPTLYWLAPDLVLAEAVQRGLERRGHRAHLAWTTAGFGEDGHFLYNEINTK